MCAVSNIGDQYTRQWQPLLQPGLHQGQGGGMMGQQVYTWPGPSREEFEALKKEVSEMKELLIKAKEEDKAAGIPDCEMEDKIKILKTVAEAVGVDLNDVFGNK